MRGGLQPATTEGVSWRKEREGAGIEAAKSGGGVKGEGVEGPVTLSEERGQERVA